MGQYNSLLNTQQMQWAATPDIDEISPFGPQDDECFRDLRDVLKKHGALDRFGIALIHKHFEIADDEVMIEFTDVENRELVVKPIKKAKAQGIDSIVTNWKLTDGDEVAQVICTCSQHGRGHGY